MHEFGDPTEPGAGSVAGRATGGVVRSGDQTEERFVGMEVLGQYKIVAKLGQGGMGAVYRASQPAVGRQAVIKVMHPWLSSDPAVAARFEAEARAAAQLQSPNIVSIFNFGKLPDGTLFLAMEYLAGRTLEEALRQEGRFSLHRAVSILEQCAAGLEEAHRKAVIHRDLKPSNVMLIPRTAGAELVKLLDFGIAKIGGSGGLTREGSMLGTPQYMAPEQVQGLPVDARADVYALGLVAYELLAGRPAFESDNPIGYIHLHINVEPAPLSSVVPDAAIPPAIEACIRRALAKDPGQRTPSAAAFASELRAAMPGTAGPPARSSGTAGIAVAIGLGATIVAGGVVGAAFVLSGGDDEKNPEIAAVETGGTKQPRGEDSDPDSSKGPDDGPNLDHLGPEERALYAKSVPELEDELHRVAVRSVGEAYADQVAQQLSVSVRTPPGVDPEPYQKQALIQTIVALRGSGKVIEAAVEPVDGSVDDLEEKFLSMDCSMSVEQRRLMANQIKVGMPKGKSYEPILKQYFAQFIEACEQGEDSPE